LGRERVFASERAMSKQRDMAINANIEQVVWALFLEFCAVFDQALDELAAIHGRDRSRLSRAEAENLEREAKTLALEFGEGGEKEIAGRYRTKDTTRLLAYLQQCNAICLKVTNAHKRIALH
jgi:hypothetical protein